MGFSVEKKKKKKINFPFRSACVEPTRRQELVSGSGLISSLLKLVSWKSLLQALSSSEQEKWDFPKDSLSWIFTGLRPQKNRARDNKQRGWKETRLLAEGGKVCSAAFRNELT